MGSSSTKKSDNKMRETSPLLTAREVDGDESQVELENSKNENSSTLAQVLVSVWMGSFLAALDGTVVANIMGSIAADFEQEQYKSWIATSYLLTNTAFQPLYGKISDIIGRKYALMIAQFFFGFGCFLSVFAQDVTQFSIARAISGIGGGGLGAMSSIIVSDVVTLEERGLYQGYANVNFASGQMLGGPLGALLLHSIGWRWIFGAQVPAVIITMILNYKFINIGHKKRITKENLMRIDYGGSLTLVLSITFFLLILSTNIDKMLLSGLFLISFISFILIEKYVAKEHIIPLDLVKGVLGLCGVTSFTGTFITSGCMFSLPLFLQIVQNQTTEMSGFYLIFSVIFVSLGSLSAGWMLKHSKYPVIKISFWITVFGVIAQSIGFITVYMTILKYEPYSALLSWKILISGGMSVIGYGHGVFLVSLLITAVAITGKEGQATATGMNYLFRAVGQVLGVGISLSIYENGLLKKLTDVLSNVQNRDEILERLKENTKYLKDRDLIPVKLFRQIIQQYKLSLVDSYRPALFLIVVNIAISVGLAVNRSNKYQHLSN